MRVWEHEDSVDAADRIERAVLSRISAGTVCINDAMIFMASPQLPFGGVGASGHGAYHGREGFVAQHGRHRELARRPLEHALAGGIRVGHAAHPGFDAQSDATFD